jgi:hypothetical protein
MSVTSMGVTLSVLVVVLVGMHISWAGAREERICGCGWAQVMQGSQHQFNHPHDTCEQTMLVWRSISHERWKRLTFDKEANVDYPHANCGRDNDPISVPNRNADNLNQHLVSGDCGIFELLMRTYMRRTIKSEDAETAKQKKACQKDCIELLSANSDIRIIK